MIQVHLLTDGVTRVGGEELVAEPGPKWIDVEAPTEAELVRLAGRFGLHKLAIEDCLHLDQRPKLEEYPGHLFIVVHGFTAPPEDVCELVLHEHHFFLGPDWLISVHERPFHPHGTVRLRVTNDPATSLGRGVDFVAYLLMDQLVDANFPLMDQFGEELDALEEKVFEAPGPEQLQRIFALKRALITCRRVLSPQRDVMGLLSRVGVPFTNPKSAVYFRDIYDHLVRLYETIDAGRDILGNVMDGYLNATAQRTNEITKQLTIFSTLFLPLSFIVGFFGQNFETLSRPVYFYLMLATMVAVPVALFFWFRHKGFVGRRG